MSANHPPLIYDLEIKRAIPNPKSEPLAGIEYCEGWHDHAGMGVAVLCVYDYVTQRAHVELRVCPNCGSVASSPFGV